MTLHNPPTTGHLMAMFGRKRTTVGLDIGSGLIKLVAIQHGSGEPVLTKVAFTSVVDDAIVEGEVMDPGIVADAIRGLKQDTVIGRLDFAGSGIKNVSKMRVVGGQWIIDDKGKLDIVVTHNGTAPEIPVQRKFELLPG